MGIKNTGFTLLIAMIFVGVVLALAATLGSLGYKQSILASDTIGSQEAFYAADSAMECALYADQQQSPSPVTYASGYAAPLTTNSINCDGSSTPLTSLCFNQSSCSNEWISSARIPLDGGVQCADLTFYEPSNRIAVQIFSEGYDVSCSALGGNARVVSRGLEAQY